MQAAEGEFTLPPLATASVTESTVATYRLADPSVQGAIEVTRAQARDELDIDLILKTTGMVGFIYFFFSIGIVDKKSKEFIIWYWTSSSIAIALILAVTSYYLLRKDRQAGIIFRQSFSLLLILAVGGGIPIFTAYYFGGGRQLLADEPSFALLARLEVTSLVAIASVMPALLFFVFDRERLSTLRRRFELQIFRFDPLVDTIEDVEARYGRQIDEIYGSSSKGGAGRLDRGTRLPLLVATLAITIGWLIALNPAGTPVDVPRADAIAPLLVPQPTTLVFGFLGAYYFTINLIVRRYVRGDLKPKTYSTIAVRILVVFILASLLNKLVGSGATTLVLAFMAGIVPETAFTAIKEVFRNVVPDGLIEQRQPLAVLDGVDLYDRARLEDEGILNLQALVNHDLVELMLATRIPVPRLVDWVDQAILRLHVPPESGGGDSDGGSDLHGDCLSRLRQLGIRTATNLENVFVDLAPGSPEDGVHRDMDPRVVSLLGADQVRSANRLWAICRSFSHDEWMRNIRYWRSASGTADLVFSLDGPPRCVDSSPPAREHGRDVAGVHREVDLSGRRLAIARSHAES